MGEVIRPGADPALIKDHADSAVKNADRQGGEIAAAAHQWLDAPLARAEEASAAHATADGAVEAAFEVVLRCDAVADPIIKKTRDDLWNAIGRPRESDVMKAVYPGGSGTYTDVDVHLQPSLMQVLEGRLAALEHPKVTAEVRAGWIASIRVAREPYETALGPLRAAEALKNVADLGWKDSIKALAVSLTRLKRHYKNLGLSEAQIHEIIPDAARRTRAVADPPAAPAEGSPRDE